MLLLTRTLLLNNLRAFVIIMMGKKKKIFTKAIEAGPKIERAKISKAGSKKQ